MRIVRQLFRENLGIKIAAIVLSLLVFFYVRTEREGELVFRVGVELKGIPDSLTWTGEAPNQVSVAFSGRLRNLLRLRLGSLDIPIDLSQTGPGRFQRELSAADVPIPEGSNVAISHFAGPARIDIMIERKISRPIRVVPLLTGIPGAGFSIRPDPSADPDSVVVSGASSLVSAVDSLLTEPVDVSQRRQSFSARAKILLPSKALKCSAQFVQVFVPVNPESLRITPEAKKKIQK